VLAAPKGVSSADYVQSLKQRFCNPAIKHRTAQIAMDGSQKLPQRLLSTLRDRIAGVCRRLRWPPPLRPGCTLR
jgi:fructuronate reductase